VAPLFWIGASLYAVGNAGFGPITSVYAIDVLPPEHRGLGIGVFRSAGDFGTGSFNIASFSAQKGPSGRPCMRLQHW
jgi:MFS family permease